MADEKENSKKADAAEGKAKGEKVVMRVNVRHNEVKLVKGKECPKEFQEAMLKAGNAERV